MNFIEELIDVVIGQSAFGVTMFIPVGIILGINHARPLTTIKLSTAMSLMQILFIYLLFRSTGTKHWQDFIHGQSVDTLSLLTALEHKKYQLLGIFFTVLLYCGTSHALTAWVLTILQRWRKGQNCSSPP